MKVRTYVDVSLCFAQSLFYVFGRIVLYDGTLASAWTVVPPQADVRIVWYRKVTLESFPFLCCLLNNVRIVVVDVEEMAELVVAGTVETDFPNKSILRFVILPGVETAVVEIWSPHGQLQFEVGETCFLHFLAEPLHGIRCLVDASKTIDKVLDIVNHKDGLAVYLVIVGLREEHLDVAPTNLLELLAANPSTPDNVVLAEMSNASVPIVEDIMVGPHQIELHAIASLEEPIRKCGLHERPSVVPVPVEDEDIDAVVGAWLISISITAGSASFT